jgi:Mg2+ and Co2+ transporter CorA
MFVSRAKRAIRPTSKIFLQCSAATNSPYQVSLSTYSQAHKCHSQLHNNQRRRVSTTLEAASPDTYQDESFKVAQVSCATGKIDSIYLPPAEILKRTSILPRDLVSLDLTSLKDQRSRPYNLMQRPLTVILPRTDSILLSFGNIRAVAGRESVFVLDAHSKAAKSFADDLGRAFQMPNSEDPPELVFLEAVLKDTLDTYFRRIVLFEPIVDGFLNRASNEVFSDQGVHQLVPLKDALQSFELQVKKALTCLEGLLNDDEEMLNLLVTEQATSRETGVPVDLERHQHVEMMVGVYARQLSNLLYEIDYLLGRVQSKQEFVALALAGYRNRLVRTNVNIAITGVSLGMITTIAGLFGMNLMSGMEESAVGFAAVTCGSTTLALMVGGFWRQFISGKAMQQRAAERLAENETLSSALSDTAALDYVVKKMMHGNVSLTKEDFAEALARARRSQQASEEEVNLLFEVLDTHKDGRLSSKDFLYGSPP